MKLFTFIVHPHLVDFNDAVLVLSLDIVLNEGPSLSGRAHALYEEGPKFNPWRFQLIFR